MSFIKCITDKIKKNLLTDKQVQQLQNKYESLVKQYKRTVGDEDAAIQAASDVVKLEAQILADKKRNTIRAALVQERIIKELDDSVTKGAQFDVAVRDMLERAYNRKQTILKQHLTGLDKFADAFRSKFAGLYQRRDGIKEVVQELLGKKN